MSQNERKFQSKGKKFGGGGKGRGKPGGGKFSKRFEGDRKGPPGGGKRFAPRDGDSGGFERRGGGKPYGRDRDSGFDRGFDRGDRDRGDRDRGDRGDRPRGKRDFDSDRPRGKRDFEGGGRPYNRDRDSGRERNFDRGDRDRSDRPRGKRDFEGGGKSYSRDRDSGRERSFDRGGDRPRGKRDFGGDRNFRDNRGGFRDGKPAGRKRPFRNDAGGKPRRARDFRPAQDEFFETELPRQPASPETLGKLKSDRPGYGSPSSAFLYGAHAVRAALQNPKRLHQRLLATQSGFELVREAYEAAQGEGLRVPQPVYVENVDIERLLPRDAVHQGILLDCQPLEEAFLSDVLVSSPESGRILVLDQVTDPHNIGAILRSAAAFGAKAVVVQKLHAPDITGTVAKSASGAVEYVPVVREVNLSRAIEQLKEAGYFCIGLAEEGKAELADLHLGGKIALVLGAEGQGLRRLVAETCDALARLPTGGPVSSLNVSNAAAIALYELARTAKSAA